MITNKIFQRSQWHEWFEPSFGDWAGMYFEARQEVRLEAIKPHQTVTRRYLLEAEYTTEE